MGCADHDPADDVVPALRCRDRARAALEKPKDGAYGVSALSPFNHSSKWRGRIFVEFS